MNLLNNEQLVKVVLTGGPFSGKSTTTEKLAEMGYSVVRESALDVISDLNDKYGVEGQKEWRFKNFVVFQEMIVNRHMISETKLLPSSGVVFIDRSPIDTLAFLKWQKDKPSQYTEEIASGYHCDLAFCLETLPEFDMREDSGRTSNYQQSVEVSHLIKDEYKNLDIDVFEIGVASLEERLEMILSCVEDWINRKIDKPLQ